ncbi:uncharacterized protein LOC108219886 [Daucus carota subsp. sativus]|uniref:uncharacterized protein LOC108219886 n=1 Tax=Daucus carota subsp. sativus TaxID=79200 RepID=UPI0007EF5C02|nr:PREDICTED: uncharacterized protein LOC108219886 [Daucus carota subsp. sativus]
MHPEKSPGKDGLNPAFFQAYWCIVGTDVVRFCQHFMSTGELPNGVNQTLACLIPKVKAPQAMTDLRPISLCNVLIRILSEVLENRLKPCLKSLISDRQSAFIEGRLLNDNALVAFEVNHYMRRLTQRTKGITGFKMDISKAYDNLEWNFTQNVMLKFGFSKLWNSRVTGSIQSHIASFAMVISLVILLRTGESVKVTQYLHIYILCAQRGLALLFDGMKRATKTEANIMKRIGCRYESISGQMINYDKSSVTFSSNTTADNRKEVCEQLGVNEAQNPGRYLGMPMYVGRRKVATFSFLSDKISKKLQVWQNQTLSKAGNVTLLKTAAEVVPNFWMSMLLIPLEVCDRIEKSMKAFWCGDGSSVRV